MNVFPKKVLNFEHKNTANSGILYVCCLRDSCRIQSGARSATDCSGGRDPLEVPPHHGGIGRPLAAKKLTRFYLLPPRGLRRNLEMLASQTLPLRGTLPPSEGGTVLVYPSFLGCTPPQRMVPPLVSWSPCVCFANNAPTGHTTPFGGAALLLFI